jgi:hypothetical protein
MAAVTRADLHNTVGRLVNMLATGDDEMPTDPDVIRVCDLLMDGIDLYVEGIELERIGAL